MVLTLTSIHPPGVHMDPGWETLVYMQRFFIRLMNFFNAYELWKSQVTDIYMQQGPVFNLLSERSGWNLEAIGCKIVRLK